MLVCFLFIYFYFYLHIQILDPEHEFPELLAILLIITLFIKGKGDFITWRMYALYQVLLL